jgi:acetoacetyl-CoA synthetase
VRIEDMAADHIRLMRTIQPEGPYTVGGYSLGGLIAYEIARQLSQAGETVERVVMIDTTVHDKHLPWRQWLRYQTERPGSALRSLRDLPPGGRMAFWRRKAAIIADRVRTRLGQEPRHLDLVVDEGRYPLALRRVRSGATMALRAYRPGRYPGKLTFLRAGTGGNRDPLPVWRRLAGELEVHEVAGDHFTLVAEANAESLAAVLDRCL